nr:MAG TPA: hypothetical protein [Caudoviricetes sp.]
MKTPWRIAGVSAPQRNELRFSHGWSPTHKETRCLILGSEKIRGFFFICLFSINALIRVAGHWSRKTTVIVRVIVREERHSTRHVRPNVKNDGVSVLAQLPHADTDTHGRNAERLSFERIRYALNA